MFKNRTEAGQKLALELETYRGKDAIVLALPRGGVVLGYEVAQALLLPLDIIAVRKIGHPTNPEYAIGAVDEYGTTLLNKFETRTIDKNWLREEVEREKQEARRRSSTYRQGKQPLALAGKIAILVDDGIATGLTMRLAMRFVRSQQSEKIVIAVPVASPESIHELKEEKADEIIVLEEPETFMGAVGAHYIEFEQVSDDKVISLLLYKPDW